MVTPYDNWVQRYGQDVADHLETWFSENDGYECMDNFRVARVGNWQEEMAYEVQKNSGCCGVYDDEIEIDDVKYRVGFNHGH